MNNKTYLFGTFLATALLTFGSAESQTTFNYTGAMQTYTVPAGVSSINIEVFGAQGGNGTTTSGGLGASMQGDFAVTPGQQFDILVGGMPATNNGGGGGTFVVENGTNVPYIIAGGGGGGAGECCGGEAGGDAGVSTPDGTTPFATGCPPGAGGIAGDGGGGGSPGNYGSGGGGGFNTNGGDGEFGGSGGGSFLSGGAGGAGFTTANGGFGGGGGGNNLGGSYINGSGGGGGGYSGGGGNCGYDNWERGGGGGSYNIGTAQVNASGVNSGDGLVVITELCDGLLSTVSADTVCQYGSVVLHAESINGGTVTWDSGLIDSVAFDLDVAGTFTFTASSDNALDCDFVIDVFVAAAPDFSLSTTDETVGGFGNVILTLIDGLFPFSYDWDNDGTGDYDDPQSLLAVSAGTYTVSVMHGNGCSKGDSATVNSQLGISDVESLANVYPNPTSGKIVISGMELTGVELFNSLGQSVYSLSLTGNKSSIDVSDLAAGIYRMKITTASGEVSKQVVLMK